MEPKAGWLKQSLESAHDNVQHWPEWKKALESAVSQVQQSLTHGRHYELNLRQAPGTQTTSAETPTK